MEKVGMGDWKVLAAAGVDLLGGKVPMEHLAIQGTKEKMV